MKKEDIIDKRNLLSDDEVNELIIRYQKYGDIEARNILLKHNIGFIKKLAIRYKNNSKTTIDLDDLYHEGVLGFIRTLDKFDVSKGFKLITYATYWVNRYIQMYIAKNSRTIRVAEHKSDILNKLKRVNNSLMMKLNRKPTIEELANAMGLSETQILELLGSFKKIISIDEEINYNTDTTYINMIPDRTINVEDEVINNVCCVELLDNIDKYLSEKEAKVIKLRNGLQGNKEHTLEEVGEIINVSKERIRQIEEEAIKKLRKVYGVKVKTKKRNYNVMIKPIFDWFLNYSKESVIEAVKMLSDSDREIVYNIYGKDLNEINILNCYDYNKVYFELSRKLFGILKYNFIYKPLTDLLKIDKDTLLERINYLSDKEKEELYNYYGYDLDNPIITQLSMQTRSLVENSIIYKLNEPVKTKVLQLV